MSSTTSRIVTTGQEKLFSRNSFLGAPFDDLKFDEVLDLLERPENGDKFRYVVTPNVDHVVRIDQSKQLWQCYDRAWLSLCDSKPIAILSQALSLNLPHVTGSELTVALFRSVIRNSDRIAIIAANEQIVSDIRSAFPQIVFRTHIPPLNVATDIDAFQRCVDFATEGQDRFIFIAIGSPQSERIAFEISRVPNSRGVGLCIGAALEFLVGTKKRAPLWMQNAGLEWLHRLASEPRRLWRRYAYSVLPLVRLFLEEIRTRRMAPG